MKASQYVEKYGDDYVLRGDKSKLRQLVSDLIGEYNSEAVRLKAKTPVEARYIVYRINDKCNDIAKKLKRKYGRPILRENWFLTIAREQNEALFN